MTDIKVAVAEAGKLIEPILEELIPHGADDYISDAFWHHTATGGKRIRPALCLLTCEALGHRKEDGIPFAASVEMLHNMFLLHDDIEDGDTIRRDAPTVWVKFGVPNAINVGDYMLGRAYSAILRSQVAPAVLVRLIGAFTATFERTCQGQALDINARGNASFTVDRYLEMVELKSGHYLALGMVGGAIIAGAGDEVIRAIQELGTNMGPAFQIRDDVIDLTLGKGRGGALGNDIREGKPSILYSCALEKLPPAEGERLREIMVRDRAETTDADVRWVCEAYERCRALEFARQKADELVAEAHRTIERIPVDNKAFFREIATFMASRAT